VLFRKERFAQHESDMMDLKVEMHSHMNGKTLKGKLLCHEIKRSLNPVNPLWGGFWIEWENGETKAGDSGSLIYLNENEVLIPFCILRGVGIKENEKSLSCAISISDILCDINAKFLGSPEECLLCHYHKNKRKNKRKKKKNQKFRLNPNPKNVN
jgi:hypothetical protein